MLLIARLVILAADALRSRGFLGPGETVSSLPQPFRPHLLTIQLTSLAVVALTIYLALFVWGYADHLTVAMVGVTCLGYATASFFGPSRWIFSVPGPMIDHLGDTGGYTRLLIADVLLDVLLAIAVVRYERGIRAAVAAAAA